MRRFRWVVQALAVGLAVVLGFFLLIVIPLWHGSRDRRLIQGTWTAEGVTVTVTGDRMVVQQLFPTGARQVSHLMFKLKKQGAAAPRIVLLDTRYATTTNTGIYDLDEDHLRLCIGTPGGATPIQFGQDGAQTWELKRAPP
jgi:hypothetical protein